MKTTIYYFSGTGNSLMTAKSIGERLDDTKLISIPNVICQENICVSENIGFVFPIYAFGLPKIMAKFIKQLKVKSSSPYFFAFATYRDEPGGALLQTSKLLKAKGYNLNAGFNIWMPGNYICRFEADSTELQQKKFKMFDEEIDSQIKLIKGKGSNDTKTSFKQKYIQYGIMYPLMKSVLSQLDRLFFVNENCNGCGVCSAVCPINNITISDGEPKFIHSCEQCMACFNWCPNAALECTKSTLDRKRYTHPDIKIKEIISSNNYHS